MNSRSHGRTNVSGEPPAHGGSSTNHSSQLSCKSDSGTATLDGLETALSHMAMGRPSWRDMPCSSELAPTHPAIDGCSLRCARHPRLGLCSTETLPILICETTQCPRHGVDTAQDLVHWTMPCPALLAGKQGAETNLASSPGGCRARGHRRCAGTRARRRTRGPAL